MNSRTSQHSTFDETQFFARVVGVLAVLTVALYLRALLAGGFLSIAPVTATGMAAGVSLAVVLLVGSVALLAAWRWEWVGGVVAVLCAVIGAVIAAMLVDTSALFVAFVYGSPLAIGGVLFLLHAWRQRRA
jgi:hypothetical protein